MRSLLLFVFLSFLCVLEDNVVVSSRMSSVVVGNYSSHTCKHDDVAMIKAPLWATKREDFLRFFFCRRLCGYGR